MRRQYLGEGWDLVLVRGTKYNVGTMLCRAIDAGARTVGHWGAAHASPQDFHGPPMGDIKISPHIVCDSLRYFTICERRLMNNGKPRYAYQYGITVNVNGQRFFDEGEDTWEKVRCDIGKRTF